MSDFIRRKDIIQEFVKTCSIEHVNINDVAIFYETIMKIINSIPSAEPERKTGKWVEYPDCLRYEGAYNDDHIVCSECGHVFSICDNCTEEFDFCPSCGADMR